MLKIFCFLLIFSLQFKLSHFSIAQSKKKSKPNPDLIIADKRFNNFEYFEAAKYYQKVLKIYPDNPYILYQLAECYRLYNNFKEAEVYYQKVVARFRNSYPMSRYWYASMLKNNANYKNAIIQFQKFRNEHPQANLSMELYREKALQ